MIMPTRVRSLAVVLAAGLAVGLITSEGALALQPQQAAPLTPEGLLAVLDPRELPRTVLADPERWWPALPQFNVGLGDVAPGLRFYVVQQFFFVSSAGNTAQRIEFALILYDTPAAAARDFAGRLLAENDRGGTPVAGPPVGDQTRYFERVSTRTWYPASPVPLPYESSVRFTVGPLVSRVSVFEAFGRRPASPAVLGQYAQAVVLRARQLLAGSLRSTPMPTRMAALMPPAAAAAAVGPVLGSAVLPAQSWAVMDDSGKPGKVSAQLRSGGVAELGFRRYALAADRGQVVEVVLFVFDSDDGAATWVQEFISAVKAVDALDRGSTGSHSAFSKFNGEFYELQFAKRRIAGDVSCFAPFGKTSAACEAVVRTVAQIWFAALP